MKKDNDFYIAIGRRIRGERARHGWTQEELAEKANVHLSFISQIERGIKTTSLITLKRIADVLGVRVAELLEESAPANLYDATPLVKKMNSLLHDRTPKEQKLLYQTLRHLVRQTKKLKKLS